MTTFHNVFKAKVRTQKNAIYNQFMQSLQKS